MNVLEFMKKIYIYYGFVREQKLIPTHDHELILICWPWPPGHITTHS